MKRLEKIKKETCQRNNSRKMLRIEGHTFLMKASTQAPVKGKATKLLTMQFQSTQGKEKVLKPSREKKRTLIQKIQNQY